MCKRCAGLIDLLGEREEEIRQLKDLLGEKYQQEAPKYGLTPTEWATFRALEDAPNKILHRERLLFLSPGTDLDNPMGALRTRITHMREKLRPHGYVIPLVFGYGYELVKTESGKELPRYGLNKPEWMLFREINERGPVSLDDLTQCLPREPSGYTDARNHVTRLASTIRGKLRRFGIGIETVIGTDKIARYRLYAMIDRKKEAA